MQHAPSQEHPQRLEMSLREHLGGLGSGAAATAPPPYPTSSAQHQNLQDYSPPDSGSPHDQHNLDPNVTGGPMPYPIAEGAGNDGLSPETRKGKRELSTSKRAAQNRAAQRAFRQRKEGYIKKLEEQVKEFQTMESNYKALQGENYQLREYILSLQSRLLESQSDFPPAPSHINLAPGSAPPPPASQHATDPAFSTDQQLRRDLQQHPPPPAQVTAREDPIRHDGISQLQAAAAQGDVKPSPYGLPSDYPNKRARPDESGNVGPKP